MRNPLRCRVKVTRYRWLRRQKIYQFPVAGDNIGEGSALGDASGTIDCLAYSPDGTKLAMGTSDREVKIWEFASNKFIVKGYWKYHTARVTTIAWAPHSVNLASGSIDGKVFVWDITKKLRKKQWVHMNMRLLLPMLTRNCCDLRFGFVVKSLLPLYKVARL